MVMLTHSAIYLEKTYGYQNIRLFFNDYWSYFGVIIFFCISGFLLTSLTAVTSWRVFIVHRIARIFPTYLIALALALAAYTVRDGVFPEVDWRIALLVPIGPAAFRPLYVEWTLVYEVAFYALMTFFCVASLRRWLTAFLVLWFVVLAFLFVSGRIPSGILPTASDIYLDAWNIGFIFGGYAWLLQRSGYTGRWGGWVGVALILSCTILGEATGVLAPAGVALILANLVQRDREGRIIFRSGVLETLGNWSYAIYLTHVPVFLLLYPLLKGGGLPPLLAWFCGIGVVLTIGGALGQLDVALYRKLKRKIDFAFSRELSLAAASRN